MPKNINQEITISGIDLTSKIHVIRGVKVMLDVDLAEIYGYETKYLNRQVKNNIEKFRGDEFMFQLTTMEAESSRCNFCTLDKATQRGHNIKYLPYAFTEQGVYMLMTVLKGELAVKQSRALIMAFKAMKDYILENQNLIDYRESLRLVSTVADNTKDIADIKNEISNIDTKVNEIASEMTTAVKRAEIPPVFLDFNKLTETKEFLLLNGKPIRAKDAYTDIYGKAKHKIFIVDNYINIKTLRLLLDAKSNLEITFFTNRKNNQIKDSDIKDFNTERPDLKINFIFSDNVIHDRFIILDEEAIYLSGGSSKDAGKRMTTIVEVNDSFIKHTILETLRNFLG